MSQYDNIPDELKERDQWLYWNGSKDAPRKPLDSPEAEYGASWSDPDEWLSFDEVVNGSEESENAGIGFVNAADNDNFPRGIYGVIDLDGVADEDGNPKDWVPSLQPFFDHDAYIEWSPSGEGIHIPIAGIEVPDWWTDQHFTDGEHEGVEVLSHKFATYTGDHMRGSAGQVVEYGDWLDEWLREAYKAVTGEDPVGNRATEIASDATDSSSEPDEEWFTEDVAEEALEYIDPDDDYPVWRDVGMALANVFGTTGAQMFESWSRGGTKWDDDAPAQAEKIVEDASDYEYDAGTLIYYAKNGGWDASNAARQQLIDARSQDASDSEPNDEDAAGGRTEKTQNPEKSDDGGITTVTSLQKRGGGYGYVKTNDEGESWFECVTNFELDVDSFLFKDGDRLIDMTVIPASGEQEYDLTVPAKVFNDARRFRDNIVTGLTTTFEGAPSDLNELRKLVGNQDAPVRTGTHHMGLHPEVGEFVTPDGVLTGDGWTDDPEMAYIEREIGAERAFKLSPEQDTDYDIDVVADILELLPQTRNADRFLPVLGWLYSAPLRPYIQQWEGQFNTLHVTGETGAGKSSTLSVAWQLLGMTGDSMACDDTKFALTTAMASTNSIPMWFDEYKPGDMKDWELDRFQTLMRKSTRGGVETRGNADKSTEEYQLGAPLMISGEQAVQGAAEERRSIQTRFLDNVKETGSDTREAFAKLTGTAYDNGGETREPPGYDLQQHAYAYYQFVTGMDGQRIKQQWQRSRDHVRDLVTTHDITGVDDLPRQGIQTVHFGISMYQRFADKVGADDLPTQAEINGALLYIARQFGDKGSRKSHLDRFVELASRAAVEEYIEADQHYTVVNRDSPEEEVAIKLSRTFDVVSKYARDYALDGEDILNTAGDYRGRINEEADKSGSYINSASQYTPDLNRCVRIDTAAAAEQLNFDPQAFGATAGTDDEDEQEQNNDPDGGTPATEAAFDAKPLRDVAEDNTGYPTVTVEVLSVEQPDNESAPAMKATVKDATTAVDVVSWDDPTALSEGKTVALHNAQVSMYDGTAQLTIVDGVTEKQPIQIGVGHTEAQTDVDSLTDTVDTATDGGESDDNPDTEKPTTDTETDDEADTDDVSHVIKQSVYQHLADRDSGEKITAAGVASRLDLLEKQATDVLDNIALKDKKIESLEEGYRVL